MPRIAGVELPKDKWVWVSLQALYGIGPRNVWDVLAKAGVDPWTKAKDLTEEQVTHIREVIDREYKVEGDLRKGIGLNIKRLMEIGSYRGQRHSRHLPVRGQRTRTNARTKRGPRKTVAGRGRRRGVGRK